MHHPGKSEPASVLTIPLEPYSGSAVRARTEALLFRLLLAARRPLRTGRSGTAAFASRSRRSGALNLPHRTALPGLQASASGARARRTTDRLRTTGAGRTHSGLPLRALRATCAPHTSGAAEAGAAHSLHVGGGYAPHLPAGVNYFLLFGVDDSFHSAARQRENAFAAQVQPDHVAAHVGLTLDLPTAFQQDCVGAGGGQCCTQCECNRQKDRHAARSPPHASSRCPARTLAVSHGVAPRLRHENRLVPSPGPLVVP